MATLYIDNKAYEADEKKNVLENCINLGFDLPYFCWHPEMGSVGACRQCAVKQYKDENDTQGKLTMSCMIPASDQTRISVDDPEAKDFRKRIIEGLMTNHPHDCPTCDEGGECHLQDMTVMTGHNYRRFNHFKRTYRNQDLGPFIHHEMNRCIHCYRCVRFYQDYAGGNDLQALASRNRTYFGRQEDGPLENEFSGNLVEVCPTGVFTDKSFRQHFTRKWDLTTAPSICTQCSMGCNIIPGERYGRLRRIRARYNSEVNRYFICDRGRYGYEYVSGDNRVKEILRRSKASEALEPSSKESALKAIGNTHGTSNKAQPLIGIGSPRASLETNYALQKLVGKENFYKGFSAQEHRIVSTVHQTLTNSRVPTPSLQEIESCDAVLVLGEDVTNTAPRMALAIRQAAKQKPYTYATENGIPSWHADALKNASQGIYGPVVMATPYETRLEDIATHKVHAAPSDLKALGNHLANTLNSDAPAGTPSEVIQNISKEAAEVLKNAKKPLIVSGYGNYDSELIKAAANLAEALYANNPETKLALTLPEANSLGLEMMEGSTLEEGLEAIKGAKVGTAIVAENDLYKRVEAQKLDDVLPGCDNLVVLDHIRHQTVEKAHCVIPVGTFAEADGTLVNYEGRAQRFYQVYVPEGPVFESWRWLGEIGMHLHEDHGFLNLHTLDDFARDMMEAYPILKGIDQLVMPHGMQRSPFRFPRQHHRYSGRTAQRAHINVHEQEPPEDTDTPMRFTMEGYRGQNIPGQFVHSFWSPGWNSINSVTRFQIEVGGPLQGGAEGIRLLDAQEARSPYFRETNGQANGDGRYEVLPLHHIFGSEETSNLSDVMTSRIPEPYVLLSNKDAESMQLQEQQQATVEVNGQSLQLPVKVSNTLTQGFIGLPVGLPGMPVIEYPAKGDIKQ